MSTAAPNRCLKLSFEAGIAEIRLDRPALLNRFDMPAHIEFANALQAVSQDASVRVLILAAEGRVFSAGGDMDEILQANHDAAIRDDMARYATEVFYGIVDFAVPVISAVQGAAVGLGATLATLSDIVIAWRGARIADPHVNLGLVAGDGGVVSWSQAVGVSRAKRYLLTGDSMTAEQAYGFGLVTELVDTPEEVLPCARAMAGRIAALPPAGVNGTRLAFARLTRARAAEAFEFGLEAEMRSMAEPGVPEMIASLRAR